MKKLLLLFLLGIFIISCSMEDEDITYGQTELITYDATYDASNSDIFSELCHDQINNPTVRGFTNYYRNLIFLHTNIKNVNGSFEPTMTQLIDQYNQAGGTGTFSTLYSAETEEHGMIELRLTVEVKNCNSVCANDVYSQLCSDQISNPTYDNFYDYYRSQIFTQTGFTTISGTFEPTIRELYDTYNEAGGLGRFATNYTVDTEECGVITIEVAVQVDDCSVEEPVCANDVYSELCSDQINNPTYDNFYDYYRSQIFTQTGFTTISGTFEPTMRELYDTYNEAGGIGRFATNYTVDTEECGVLTIEVAVQVTDCQ